MLEHQKKSLNREVKNLKSREAQLMTDYSELEEENCILQKQVCRMKIVFVDTVLVPSNYES